MRHTHWEKTATVFRGRKAYFPHTSSFAVWTLVTLALALLIGLASYASLSLFSAPQASAVTTVPTKLNFQGRLSDSAGSIKPNGTYNMKFKLYTVATAGTSVWSEDRLVSATQGVTVTNGLFSVQLGSITSLPASLFASGALYLEVELPTPATATSSTPTWTEGPMTPRNQMATSAYAYNSETLDGQDGAWYQDATNLTGTVSAARLSGSYTGITGTGALAAGSIAAGFGTISTANTITGTTLNGTTGFQVAGAAATGTYLRGNGTNFVGSAIQAADVPTLNQNTTGTAYYLASRDTRAVNDAPQDFNLSVKFDFKQNTTNGLSDGGTYNGVMTWRKYGSTTDFSGGPALQMAYSDNGNLWTRLSTSATTWGGWTQVLNDVSGVKLQATAPGTAQTGNMNLTGVLQGSRVISTIATGTAPLAVTSTTKVTNLNVDLLDGLDSTAFALASGGGTYIQNTTSPQSASFSVTGTGYVGTFLEVGGSGTGDLLRIQTANTGNTSGGLLIQSTSAGSAYFRYDRQGSWAGKTYIGNNASTVGNSPTTAITIDGTSGTNRVGIGTTSPGSTLEVNGITRVGSNFNTQKASSSGVVLGIGSEGAEWIHSGFGNGFGSKIYSVDSGSGVTSTRLAVRSSVNNSWTDAITVISADNSTHGDVGVNTRLNVVGSNITYTRTALSGAISFSGTTSILNTDSTNNSIGTILPGDFNGDNSQDIATNAVGVNEQHLFKGNGNGTFQTKIDTANGGNATVQANADVDNDGDQDVIVHDATNSYKVLTNNGTGAFTVGGSVSIGFNTINDIATGDINKDGKVDLVLGKSSAGGFDIAVGNGNGTFTAGANHAFAGTINSIIVADFNNDSWDDVAYYDSNTTAYIKLNNGAGVLGAATSYAGVTSQSTSNTIVAADFNGDGFKDIAHNSYVSGGSSTVSVRLNNGSGGFGTRSDYTTSFEGSYDLVASDINGDARPDLITSAAISGCYLITWANNGNGTFATYTYTTMHTNVSCSTYRVASADWNSDGKNDVAAQVFGSVYVYYSTSTGAPAESSAGTLSVTTGSSATGGIYIKGSTGQTASLLTIQNASGAGLFSVDPNGNLRVKGTVSGGYGSPDYAENITASDPTIQAADVVAIDPANREHVIKSSQPYQVMALGVISTSPGFVTNATAPDAGDSTQRPLALSGRVPVKVTNENGPIQPGDYLTTSSTPGYAMKATASGHTIGRAMEGFDGESGKVLMFIDNSYYNPYGGQNIQGSNGVFASLVVSGQIQTKELVVEGNSTFEGSITVKGHVVSGGETPQTQLGVALGGPGNAQVELSLEGNDTSGEITIVTGSDGQSYVTGDLLKLTFSKVFTKAPRIMLSASNEHAVRAGVFVADRSREGFILRTLEPLAPNTTYTFTYWAVE